MEDTAQTPELDEHGRTRAFYVSQKDTTGELLSDCLDEGVDPDVADSRGDTVMHWAAWNGRPAALRVLLDRKANPNVQNHKGHTPLHHVIVRNKVGSPFPEVRALLAGGADPLLADGNGETAYHALARRSKSMPAQDASSIAQVLSEFGGTDGWFLPNLVGLSPLDIAAATNDPNLAVFVAALQASILERQTTSSSPASFSPGRRL